VTRIPVGDAAALLEALVRVDSRNPSLVAGAPGEVEVARQLREILHDWKIETTMIESAHGRPNVVARRPGRGGGRSLMFNGHLDVVGVEGMLHPAFDATTRDGRLYGRGASDMKGGVAAMCAALARLPELDGDVVVTAVCDEEWQSIGTASVLQAGIRADAAIVTEPTGLAIMPAHKGFVWAELSMAGRAAHGSRPDLGVDAIRHAGAVLRELDALEESLAARTHPLLGRASLHASTIEGGTGMSTYPDRCSVRVERRTIPGESVADVRTELGQALWRAGTGRAEFAAELHILFAQPPSDLPTDAPVVRTLAGLLEERGLPSRCVGMSAWTDAALLNEAGIPAICFGPGDMGLAHAAEEYIELAQVESATEILVALARRWCTAE
jgi:acetylornithine deacetylase